MYLESTRVRWKLIPGQTSKISTFYRDEQCYPTEYADDEVSGYTTYGYVYNVSFYRRKLNQKQNYNCSKDILTLISD